MKPVVDLLSRREQLVAAVASNKTEFIKLTADLEAAEVAGDTSGEALRAYAEKTFRRNALTHQRERMEAEIAGIDATLSGEVPVQVRKFRIALSEFRDLLADKWFKDVLKHCDGDERAARKFAAANELPDLRRVRKLISGFNAVSDAGSNPAGGIAARAKAVLKEAASVSKVLGWS